jgi:sugar phosphate isomerase/epimerase
VIVCSGTFGDVPFPVKARAAASAGFDGISIYGREVEPGLRPLLDDLGLAVAEVDGSMAWLPGQRGPEPERVLDIAVELGARSVTVLETTGEALDPGVAAEAFARLCDDAFLLGLLVHIEPFAWSGIATLGAAEEIVARAGRPTGGILLDTWHLVRGPEAGVLDPAAVGSIVAVQVSDPSTAPRLSVAEECMHDRLLPGPVARGIVDELRALGCDAPLEVEVFSDALHDLEPADAARLARDAYLALA